MAILKKISVVAIFCLAQTIFADDLGRLDSAYQSGNIQYLQENLPNVQSDFPEEKERIDFYKAVTQSSPNFVQELEKISAQPNNQFSQAALLELSKVYYLKKDYSKALKYLDKITKPALQAEKSYWTAYSLYALADYKVAIQWAQEYQQLARDNDRIENTYILISNCYIKLGKYDLALKLLLSLEKLKLLSSQRAAGLYNISVCYEELNNPAKQKETVFLLKKDFPYSKYAELLTERDLQVFQDDSLQPQSQTNSTVYLQVGAFGDEENAADFSDILLNKGFPTKIHKDEKNSGTFYKVWAGPFANSQDLQAAKSKLLAENYPSFVVEEQQTQSQEEPLQQTPAEQSVPTLSHKSYYLECGVFTDPAKLQQRLQRLKKIGVSAQAYKRTVGSKSFIYGVIGPFSSKEEALAQQRKLKRYNLASNIFIK